MTHLPGPIIIHRLQNLRLSAHHKGPIVREKKDSGVTLSVNDNTVPFFVKQH